MTILDDAAEAICEARTVECVKKGCCEFYKDHARIAITSLLENPALVDVVRNAKCVEPFGGSDWPHNNCTGATRQHPECVIAAIKQAVLTEGDKA